MIVPIGGLLDAAALARIAALLGRGARFEDGRRTAGWHARGVKDNEQAAPDDPATREAAALVAAALTANPVFRAAALPRRLRPVLFARYRGGGPSPGAPTVGGDRSPGAPNDGGGHSYGAHTDDALMGLADPAGPTRADVAVTVFLAEPDRYEGGELVIEGTGGEAAYKLGAGCALAYPATTLHRVAPVTAGERLVAVTWAQSLVRDPAAREILFDLDTARRAVFAGSGDTEAFRLLAKSHANLLRRWAET